MQGGAEPALPCSRRSLLLRNPLGSVNNSLIERVGQIVRFWSAFIVAIRTHSPVVRPTRRASGSCFALSGVGHDIKVLLDFFQKIAGSTVRKRTRQFSFGKLCGHSLLANCMVPFGNHEPLVAPSQWSEISFPIIKSGEFENPIKGCSIWEGGSMPPSHT